MKFDRDIDKGATEVVQVCLDTPEAVTAPPTSRSDDAKWPIVVIGVGLVTTLIWCGSLAAGLVWLLLG
jgi:hypothetical protein